MDELKAAVEEFARRRLTPSRCNKYTECQF